MTVRKDEFEDEEFEEEEFEEIEEEDDLFEEQEEDIPSKPSKTRKKKNLKKATVEVQDAKSSFTKYLLIGIAALCLVGGALWIVLPVLMPGNQAQYSANQNFQTTAPTIPQPQQAGSSNNLFVEPAPKPAVQEPLVEPPQPNIQSTNTMAAGNQSMADPVSASQDDIEDNRFDDLHEMMAEQGKELEKLEKIFAAVQELKNRPTNNESFANNELLKKENEDLLQSVAQLEAENKDLKGKNTYLRHLHSKQKAKIEELDKKLSQARLNEGPDRFVKFSNTWQLTGLTSRFAIFRNTKDLSVVRVNKGEAIDGVKIVEIDSYAGIIKTSVGDIIFNAG